jgi:hypothetical protein
MKKFALVASIFSASLLMSPNVFAEEVFPAPDLGDSKSVGFETGNVLLTLSGSGNSDKDFDNSNFVVNIAPSYFVTNNLELGIRQTIVYTDSDFSGATTGVVLYNFQLTDSRLVPFVGVSVGRSYGDNSDDAWTGGPEAGLKYLLTDSAFIFGSIGYGFDLEDGFDEGGFNYNLGIGIKL